MIIPNLTTSTQAWKRDDHALPSLVVCRDFGARGLTVCKLICNYLSKYDESGAWQLYAQAAHEMEAHHEAFLRLAGGMYSDAAESEAKRQNVISLMKRGHGVFVGDLEVECSLQLGNTFRVRLTGSMDKRIEWLMKTYKLDAPTARLCILSHEETRRCRPQTNGRSLEHPLHYHLTLNTDDLSELLICRWIADSLMEWWEEHRLHPMMAKNSSPPAL